MMLAGSFDGSKAAFDISNEKKGHFRKFNPLTSKG